MASKLILFTQFSNQTGKPERQVAIDPKKVSHVRQTVHGSTYIGYSKDFGFEVTEKVGAVVDALNTGRAEA